MKRKLTLIMPALIILLLLFSCSGPAATPEAASSHAPQSTYDSSVGRDMLNKDESEYYNSAIGEDSAAVPDPLRKIIWNGEASIESQDYDASSQALQALVGECGGYVESSSITGLGSTGSGQQRMRSMRLTARIPYDNFQLFMNGAAGIATLRSSSTSSSDVTDAYFDTESRLAVLRVKEQRLMDMIAREGSLEDLIKLENELSETLYEIESLTGTLRKYDGLIEYSTVTVHLYEVTKQSATPSGDGVMERLSDSFGKSLAAIGSFFTALFIFVVGNSPVIVLLLLTAFVIIMIVRAVRKKKKAALPDVEAPRYIAPEELKKQDEEQSGDKDKD